MKSLHITFLTILILAVLLRVLFSFLFPPRLTSGHTVSFETTLLTEPTSYGNYQKITVSFTNGWSSVPIVLILLPESTWHYGQRVAISGSIETSKSKRLVMYHPDVHTILQKQNVLLSISFFLRQKIQELYSIALPQKSASLLLGIVLGVKGNFPQNFLSDLKATGVMHVIAASGMNVSMVSLFLLGIISIFMKRQWAVIFTIAGLLLYCVLSGMQASILRATIMLVFALAAQLFGRQYVSLYGVVLAAGGMLLFNPLWILDIGFQLSFAATIGIFFLKPLLPPWGIFADDMGTTIAAQIATLPILIGSFGSYGVLSILVNALVLWTIPPLMILGGVGGLVGLVFQPAGKVLIVLSEPLLWFFESVVTFFGSLHWQVSLTSIPLSIVVGYYLVVGSIMLIVKNRKNRL